MIIKKPENKQNKTILGLDIKLVNQSVVDALIESQKIKLDCGSKIDSRDYEKFINI